MKLCSTYEGYGANNPTDPYNLTSEQVSLSVSYLFKNTKCFGVSLRVGCCASSGRNILFTGASDATPVACPSPPPSSTLFNDPHVRTLSGAGFDMHGVGVFEYASMG